MYILFINLGGKCEIFFLLNLIIIVIKKNLSNPWVQPNPCGLGWIEFFLTHHGGLSQKIPSPRPNSTHAHS